MPGMPSGTGFERRFLTINTLTEDQARLRGLWLAYSVFLIDLEHCASSTRRFHARSVELLLLKDYDICLGASDRQTREDPCSCVVGGGGLVGAYTQ